MNSVYHDIWWLGDKVVTNQYNFSFDIEIEFEANPRPDPVIWKMQFEKGRNGATVDEGKSRRTYQALDIEEDVSNLHSFLKKLGTLWSFSDNTLDFYNNVCIHF